MATISTHESTAVHMKPYALGAYLLSALLLSLCFACSAWAAELQSWDVSASETDAVQATLEAQSEGDFFTLTFTGTGAVKDFAQASETPWAAQAEHISDVRFSEGVTHIGSYSVALPHVQRVSAVSVTSIGAYAFAGTHDMYALDLSQASIKDIDLKAFEVGEVVPVDPVGAGEGTATEDTQEVTKLSIYLHDSKSSEALYDAVPLKAKPHTALIVLMGGSVDITLPHADRMQQPVYEGHTFVTWTSDPDLMHPESDLWIDCTRGLRFARFSQDMVVEDPCVYEDSQGLDQRVLLLDYSYLPKQIVAAPGIMFYGEDALHYDNRFVEPHNGNDPFTFSFKILRGTNINGGDAAYFKTFTLPYISILNDQGEVVADYRQGSGNLKLLQLDIDGSFENTTGGSVWAVNMGVDAGVLDAGHYVLRFDKNLGSNNGKSVLGKHVDFAFDVTKPAEYELTYNQNNDGLEVTGLTFTAAHASGHAVEVTIPDFVDGAAVTSVAADAFAGMDDIASVTVPETVTSIGSSAFAAMPGLESVRVLSRVQTAPVWGTDVFKGSGKENLTTQGDAHAGEGTAQDDSYAGEGNEQGNDASGDGDTHHVKASCVLYGYDEALTVKAYAETDSYVTYASLNDGVYVNNKRYEAGSTIALNPDTPVIDIRVMQNGCDITKRYQGFCSQTQVLSHAGYAAAWEHLTATANGTAHVVIREVTGAEIADITCVVSGMPEDATGELVKLDTAQGNGCTVQMIDTEQVLTKSYDETLLYWDDYLVNPRGVLDCSFTFTIGGPGSAWGVDRWDWLDWKTRFLDPHISLLDKAGQVIATFGNGLTWVTLTDSPTVTLQVNPDILTQGETYTLVIGRELTGHNIAAHLMKDIHFTFTVSATPLDAATVSTVDSYPYEQQPVEPEITLTLGMSDIALWNPGAFKVETTERSDYELVEGTDYELTYGNNDAPGTGYIDIQGKGNFSGEVTISFEITKNGPQVVEGGSWQSNSTGWWYEQSDGTYIANDMAWINGSLYSFGDCGYMHTGWYGADEGWYYFGSSGAAYTGWGQVGSIWYLFGADGIMLTGHQKVGGWPVYLEASGALHTGWLYEDGIYHYYDGGGWMVYGWKYVNGNYYYFDPVSGDMATGLTPISGSFAYFADWGGMQYGWKWVNDAYYYFGDSGYSVTGWQKIGSTWYLFADDSKMLTGHQKVGGWPVYLEASGALHTGWLYEDGIYHYYDGGGWMVYGWKYVNGNYYFFDQTTGEMLTGFVRDIYGSDYLFASWGGMQTGWAVVDGKDCYFGSSGAMAKNTWVGNYYLGSDGFMLRDTVTPDGWSVDENGHCIY